MRIAIDRVDVHRLQPVAEHAFRPRAPSPVRLTSASPTRRVGRGSARATSRRRRLRCGRAAARCTASSDASSCRSRCTSVRASSSTCSRMTGLRAMRRVRRRQCSSRARIARNEALAASMLSASSPMRLRDIAGDEVAGLVVELRRARTQPLHHLFEVLDARALDVGLTRRLRSTRSLNDSQFACHSLKARLGGFERGGRTLVFVRARPRRAGRLRRARSSASRICFFVHRRAGDRSRCAAGSTESRSISSCLTRCWL